MLTSIVAFEVGDCPSANTSSNSNDSALELPRLLLERDDRLPPERFWLRPGDELAYRNKFERASAKVKNGVKRGRHAPDRI